MKTKLYTQRFKICKIRNRSLFRTISIILMFAFLNLEYGCNYYKVNKLSDLTAELSKQNLEIIQKYGKYIIVHKDGFKYHVYNIQITENNMVLKASYENASSVHNLYAPGKPSNKRLTSNKDEWKILDEAHIITSTMTIKQDSTIEIPLSSIQRIDIIERDSGRILLSYLGGALVFIALIAIIVAATKSSCPFVYVQEGTSSIFKGEIFGGAILKPLERDDYMHLSTLNKQGPDFKIKITNELKERQYTNLAEVILAEHDLTDKILIDSKGRLHSVTNPQSPKQAVLNSTINYTNELAAVDSSFCAFNSEGLAHHVNELVLKFNKPQEELSANLIVNAKNSLWLDYSYGAFTKLFGIYYSTWIEKQRNEDADKLKQWGIQQSLPLSVYLKEKTGWHLVERIPTIGPLATRDLCIPFNLKNVEGNQVEIKLVCGYMFWEVDYAAMDFSHEKKIVQYELKPVSAIDENGQNVTSLLAYADRNYLQQPYPRCATVISYHLPLVSQNKAYEVFLHTRGYYEHVRNYTGLPDKELLESFKQEGAFIDFSKNLYDELSHNLGVTAISKK